MSDLAAAVVSIMGGNSDALVAFAGLLCVVALLTTIRRLFQ